MISNKALQIFIFMAGSILFIGCVNQPEKIEESRSGQLVHTVILDLKDDVTLAERNSCIGDLKSLSQIPETINLFVASYRLTKDDRAKTDYDLILQMSFNSEEDLYSYSNHPFHLEVRSKIKNFLAAKPVVYDYVIE